MYHLNYLIKNAKNKEKLEKDFSEIIKNQGPILKQEAWSIYEMNEN
ncbi:plasmid mobilization domain protein [Acinetobacter pittii]|nr:plasmid mobilization domain protein [Acinetobacter pittii]